MARKIKVGAGFAGGAVEIDMTPMIDMTFQLIAFFMVLINFNQAEQNQKIQLPASVLAKPAEGPLEFPITIHVTEEGRAILGGQEMEIEALGPYLVLEGNALEAQGKAVKEGTIIVRGHKDSPTGRVQKVIEICQQKNFEKFALRAKEEAN